MAFYQISCPNCHHIHAVPEHYLKDRGSRLLKCAKCAHVWRYVKHATPDLNQGFQDSSLDSPPTMGGSHIKNTLPLKIKNNNKRSYYREWWLLIIAALIALVLLIRETGSIPYLDWSYTDAQKLYYYVRNLIIPPAKTQEQVTLTVLTSNLTLQENHSILKVKGEIVNHSQEDKYIPPIIVKLMDKCPDGNGELCLRHSWSYQLDNLPLKPGERRIFETSGPPMKDSLPTIVLVSLESSNNP